MSGLSGPVRTLPGNISPTPPDVQCDHEGCLDHGEWRIQGETNEHGAKYVDYCSPHYTEYKARIAAAPPILDECEICGEYDVLVWKRDEREGATGPIYHVCKIHAANLDKSNADFTKETSNEQGDIIDSTCEVVDEEQQPLPHYPKVVFNLSGEDIPYTPLYEVVTFNEHDSKLVDFIFERCVGCHENDEYMLRGLKWISILFDRAGEYGHFITGDGENSIDVHADNIAVYVGNGIRSKNPLTLALHKRPDVAFGLGTKVITELP